MKFALILLASLFTTVAAAEIKKAVTYKAICQLSETYSCHYGTWEAGSWFNRQTAQEDADRHNANCKGHSAHVIENP